MKTQDDTVPATDGRFEPNYPPELPVSAHHEEILAALRSSPVTIVCGDTGSGKTTQLPKMALELGGVRVACTQPRRLAAVTMAERVASELKSEVGGLVGYQHRFGRRLSRDTRVKFMTDGVLLAETRHDPLLRAYDVIIVDEAHERSLNVDFLLGILKRVLARRRDLKVIVSSATLDTARFSAFFGNAPVISVPGRLFPVEVRYAPPPEDDERDLPRDVSAAVDTLPPRDDILVFLPGERDIRETADELSRRRPGDDVIPLLASLPAAEQQRAFRSSPRRRIILATNVAETSVTIPGIRCVIDSGLARISRYIHRTQIQRLQIEPVSQASARQRAGRCGRLGPGICVRLYSQDDFDARDAYTPPEVLRSSLAGVILTMLDLRLGDIESFPFLEPPRPTMVREGLRELLELGAIHHDREDRIALTETGRKLAKIPVEPRLARMLLAAGENACLPSAIPIVAAMSCDDPKRRPIDEKQKADQAHAPFRVAGSDFLGTLRLWKWWCDETKDLSQSKARALAKKTYLSYPKMREWRDLVRQLTDLCRRLDLCFSETQDSGRSQARQQAEQADNLHRSLLSGLLGRIGKYDPEEREYRGAHGLRFTLHPSSVLLKKVRAPETRPDTVNAHRKTPAARPPAPEWVMAGELVDTERLFARNAAVLDPRWLESVARGVCKRHCHSPEWDPANGFVRATEQVTLYGLVIVPARRCDFARYDLPKAREIFIRRGLVDGDFPRPPPDVRRNTELLADLRRRAEKARRPEIFDEERLCAHFQSVLPADVANADALRRWLRTPRPEFLLKKSDWWPAEAPGSADFPDVITIGGAKMALTYRNAPDDPEEDGITCTVRKSRAAALRLWRADWLVPGALPEKLAFLVSTLPAAQRRVLSPVSDTVAGLLAKLRPGSEPLLDAVRRTVYEEWGFRIPPDAWNGVRIPNHLRVRFRIRDDETGRVIATSRDLDEVLAAAGVDEGGIAAAKPAAHDESPSSSGTWTFGTIPEKSADSSAGWALVHYPALHDDGTGVSLHLYASAAEAAAAHDAGVARLYLLALGSAARQPFRRRKLPFRAALYLEELAYDDDRVASDILAGAVREAYVRGLPAVRDGAEFERRLSLRRPDLIRAQTEIAALLAEACETAGGISETLESTRLPSETVDSVLTQLAWLVFPGCARTVPLAKFRHYRRYLKAVAVRLERARNSPSSDLEKEARFVPYWELYRETVTAKGGVKRLDAAALAEYRWMLEEYRVSVFAPELRTAEPVSPKRLAAKWAEVDPDL